MSTVQITRRIDLSQLGHPATMRWYGDTGEVDAPGVGKATLQAAVDACPEATADDDQPGDADRIDILEAKLAAVEALATRADATAQEVAQAMRDAAPGNNR